MTDPSQNRGPGKGVIQAGQQLLTTLVGIVETRLRLAVIELEEEKANLIQMLMLVGLTLLFAAFGLMSLLVLVIWAVPVEQRLMTVAIITATLFILALIFAIWTLKKSRRSTLLNATRRELKTDRERLEEKK